MNNKQHSSKEQHKRIVIKVGTNLLTTKQRQFDSKKIKLISNQIIKLKQLNKEIVLVSSGAITLGKGKIKYKDTITRNKTGNCCNRSKLSDNRVE
jgi:glutamate 5-kinase